MFWAWSGADIAIGQQQSAKIAIIGKNKRRSSRRPNECDALRRTVWLVPAEQDWVEARVVVNMSASEKHQNIADSNWTRLRETRPKAIPQILANVLVDWQPLRAGFVALAANDKSAKELAQRAIAASAKLWDHRRGVFGSKLLYPA
jgi:hypothetical protein